jgi:hypothetical protein
MDSKEEKDRKDARTSKALCGKERKIMKRKIAKKKISESIKTEINRSN